MLQLFYNYCFRRIFLNYKKSFDIRSLDLTLIEFPLESCGVNEIANSINVFVDGNKMKKIRGRDINFIPHIVKLIATFLPNELQMVSSSLSTFLALN